MGRTRWVCLGSQKIRTDTRHTGRVFHHGPKHDNAVRLMSIIIIINFDFKIGLFQIIVSCIYVHMHAYTYEWTDFHFSNDNQSPRMFNPFSNLDIVSSEIQNFYRDIHVSLKSYWKSPGRRSNSKSWLKFGVRLPSKTGPRNKTYSLVYTSAFQNIIHLKKKLKK